MTTITGIFLVKRATLIYIDDKRIYTFLNKGSLLCGNYSLDEETFYVITDAGRVILSKSFCAKNYHECIELIC